MKRATLISSASWLGTVLLLAGACQFAFGSPVTVRDFSFEESTITSAGGTGGVSTNWSSVSGGGNYVQNISATLFNSPSLPAPADGTNYLVEQMNGHVAYCSQDVGLLQPNTTYTLTIAVGQDLTGSSTGQGFIALLNGPGMFSPILSATAVDASKVAPGTFADSTVSFSTPYNVSGDLSVLMEGTNLNAIPFDNVRLDATPLPQSVTALLPSVTTPLGTSLSSPTNLVYVGTPVTLAEAPAGQPPFGYQWQSDNGTGGATFSPITGATATNFVVNTSSLSANSTVEYRVMVTNSLGTSISPSVSLTATDGPPVLVSDTLPSSASNVVGDTITFTVAADGSRPLSYQWENNYVPIPGATNTTLTLTNLQLTDSSFYSVTISNALGVATSTLADLTVYPAPAATNGVIIAIANQLGLGGNTDFVPTWVVATNSLLAGELPSGTVGDFQLGGAGGVSPLTDGKFGALHPAGTASPDEATCGTVSAGAGSLLTYMLPASTNAPNGWDISQIVVYGGWSDGGRDQQSYHVLASTFAAPTNFVGVSGVTFLPSDPNGLQSATRITFAAPNGGVLVKNAAAVQLNFNILQPGWSPENGYEGYSEIDVFGTPAPPAPVVVADTLPATGVADAGDSVTFAAAFGSTQPLHYQWRRDTGSGPVPIPGATDTTLTIDTLQVSDTGHYSCLASNALGTVVSTPNSFTVNSAPTPDSSGVVEWPANQTGYGGTRFTPTWAIAAASIIAGALPSSSAGNFQLEGAGGVSVLTDGRFGAVGNANNATSATAGANGGTTLIYTLPGSEYGYDLTNITLYGGWSDNGRVEQAYTISYSTVTAPTTFIPLTSFDYPAQQFVPSGVPATTRVAYTPGSAGSVLATNVAAVMFDFSAPNGGGENGYEGYAEVAIYGTASAAVPIALLSDTEPVTGSDVEGSQVTFTTAFASPQPLSYQWEVNTGSGPVPIPGATQPTLTLNNLHLSDAGAYNCVASNALGVLSSTPNSFTVNSAPGPDGYGVIESDANQSGYPGATFNPTWRLAPGSLIAGMLPSDTVGADFANGTAGGVGILTDGQAGPVGDGNLGVATCGANAGKTITYILPGSAGGYDLTNIVVYGGWSDSGRDEQAYTINYSTVMAPTTFVPLTAPDYLPTVPSGVANTTRISFTPSSTPVLAANVYALQFDFTQPNGGGENGYEGYSEIDVYGTPSASVQITLAPVLIRDVQPFTGADVVGSEVTFNAVFDGSTPISYQWHKDGAALPGATGPSLTITNLQPSDSGAYYVTASNTYGNAGSSTNRFTVNPVPAPTTNGVVISPAFQMSAGEMLFPTWTVAPGDLLQGLSPSSASAGNFAYNGAAGVAMLTDGSVGQVGGYKGAFASCGSGVGTYVSYLLPNSAAGASLTKIVTYGGWQDGGRDQQHYTVYYSTVSNPTNFIPLTSASYDPTVSGNGLPSNLPTADRLTITSASGAPLANNVAAVMFDFTNPSGENGWSGYSELALYSGPAAPAVSSALLPGGKLALFGSGGTPGGPYTWLTSTNLSAPLSTWLTNSAGTFGGNGGFTNVITLQASQPAQFFLLRIP